MTVGMEHDIVVLFERKLSGWHRKGVFHSHTYTICFSSTISNYCCPIFQLDAKSKWQLNYCSACQFNPGVPYLEWVNLWREEFLILTRFQQKIEQCREEEMLRISCV